MAACLTKAICHLRCTQQRQHCHHDGYTTLKDIQYLSCIFNATQSSALLHHIWWTVSDIWRLRHLIRSISVSVVLYSSKAVGSSWFGQFNYSYTRWMNHEYAMSVWMYSQRTMLVELKVWHHILRPGGGVETSRLCHPSTCRENVTKTDYLSSTGCLQWNKKMC